MHTMEDTPGACDIDRLPEDLLVHVISLASPADAFLAASVSRAFHAAADSDTVWSSFLPRELPRFAKKELPRTPPSTKKGMFRRLADEPALLPGKFVRMQLDKATGAKCVTFSASALNITQNNEANTRLIRVGSVPGYSNRGKSFSQAGDLGHVSKLEINAKIQRSMLSPNTTYLAYMVFKFGRHFYGFDFPFQEASFGVVAAGNNSIRQVCLQGYVEDADDSGDEPPRKHIIPSYYPNPDAVPPEEDVLLPRKKADGWMEVELGEFHNEGGDDGEVSVGLTETTKSKNGLVVWAIVIRSKQ